MTPTLIVIEQTAGGDRVPVSPDNPVPVSAQPLGILTPGAGGASFYGNAALSSTKAEVKATAGTLFGWQIQNTAAAITYIQVFNKAAADVTVGTTVPDFVLGIPASSVVALMLPLGINMSTGITIAATTTTGGSTGPATAAVVALFYA